MSNKKTQQEIKADKRAAALRDNLRKRKAAQAQKKDTPETPPNKNAEEG